MPTYLATKHAVIRAQERFPGMATILETWADWARWIARAAQRGVTAAQQAGADLMLQVEIATPEGAAVVYLPVTAVGSGDRWFIRTVLTEEQGRHNIAVAEAHYREVGRAAWRLRKGFTRPYARTNGLQRHAHELAA